ncbi:MAG: NAD(P)H-hydrate dehydratase [Pseudomonadota bacterium]
MTEAVSIRGQTFVLSPDAMGAVDRATISSGCDGYSLMSRAAQEVVRLVCRLFPPCRVLVICGPGNNGGDGYLIARRLVDIGWSVDVTALYPQRKLVGDAATAKGYWKREVLDAHDINWGHPDLIIDAIFGTGFSKELEGDVAQIFANINAAGASVVAVDVPSGVDGMTGEVRGSAVSADHTVTFCCAKPGLLMLPGSEHAGRVHVVDIGIKPQFIEQFDQGMRINCPALWRSKLRLREPRHNKYDFGHVLLKSGSALSTGAVRLAATSALKAGAGLVSIACRKEEGLVCASQLTEVMTKHVESVRDFRSLLEDKRFNAVVLGPALGVGPETREIVASALVFGRSMVLDADALTSFTDNPNELFEKTHNGVVLTPHAGEFARIFNTDTDGDRLLMVRNAAKRSHCVVVLKGADTIVAAPDGRIAFSPAGSPQLATAGTGDVLAGAIGGLAAQGLDAFDAACAGTWLHAKASMMLADPFIAGDLIDLLPKIRSELLLA